MTEKPGALELLLALAHELHSPLHSILANADLAIAELGDVESAELASSLKLKQLFIKQQSNAVVDGINRLTQLVEYVISETEIRPRSVCAVSRLKQIANRLEPAAKKRGDRIVVASPAPVDCVVDPEKIDLVVTHLVDNAIKATQKGTITLKAWIDTGLCISVEDTGPGIPPGRQNDLFDPFKQWEANGRLSADRPYTGVGLAVSKSLLRRMDGEIEVESDGANGARFTIWVPQPA